MTMQSRHRWQFIAGLATLLVIGALIPAWAENNGKSEGGTGKYANLSALWWQWASAQPAVDVNGTNTHPVLDTIGEYAAVGQEAGIGPGNKFFFLAGAFFAGDVERTVTVPAGKALFFPVINIERDNANDPPTDNTVPQLRAEAKEIIDGVISSKATLDDVKLEIFRTKSPTFDYTVPDANSIYDYFGLVGPQFEGRIKPAAADGYWVYVPPLASGEYTLKFEAVAAGGFSLNVTYFLTIE
jgi:hypothetical protein